MLFIIYLIRYRFHLSVECIVYQLQHLVAIATLGSLHEVERCLNWPNVHLALAAVEVLAILIDALDEEHRMVVACDGETRHGYLHRLMEPLAVTLLQVDHLGRAIAIIKGGRDVCIVTIETIEVVLGVHQPLGIAEEQDDGTRILGTELIQLVEHLCQLR